MLEKGPSIELVAGESPAAGDRVTVAGHDGRVYRQGADDAWWGYALRAHALGDRVTLHAWVSDMQPTDQTSKTCRDEGS